MRPLSLNMQYFGPFMNETIDFRSLSKSQLFLICGKTGSGKTMIFDAMVYALFGKTSTETREESDLRSHFADPKLPTKVQFEFEIKGTEYQIIRTIKYIKEGNKNPTNPTVEVYKKESNEWALVTSSINASNDYLKSLLHMNVKQFRQILILPQGEFKQFLVSNSTDKRSILRTLFDSDRFEALQEKLEDEMKKEISMIEKHYQKITQYVYDLHDFDNEELIQYKELEGYRHEKVVEALEQFNNVGARLLSELDKKYKTSEQQVEEIEKYFEVEKLTMQNFEMLEDKKKSFAALHDQLSHITHLKNQLKYLKTVQSMTYQYDQLHLTKKELNTTENEYNQLQKESEETNLQFEEVKQKLSIKLNDQSRIESYKEFIKQTAHIQTNISQYKEALQELPHSIKMFKDMKTNIEDNEGQLKTLNALLDEHAVDDQIEQEKLKKQENLILEIENLKNKQEQYAEKNKLIEKKTSLIEKIEELNENKLMTESKIIESDNFEVLSVEDEIIKIQKHVHLGETCPICGSEVKSINGDIDFEAIKQEKAMQQELIKAQQNISNELVMYKERMNTIIEQINNLSISKDVSEELESAESALAIIKKEINGIRAHRQEAQNIQLEIRKLEKHISEQKLDYNNMHHKIERFKKDASYFKSETKFETIDAFVKQFEQYHVEVNQFDSEVESLKEQVEQYKEKQVEIQNKINTAKERKDIFVKQIESSQSFIETEMKKHHIESYEQLDELLGSVSNIHEYEVEIEEFEKKYNKLEADVIELRGKVKNKIKPDLEQISNQLSHAKASFVDITKEHTELKFKIEQNSKKRNEIFNIITLLEQDLSEQEELIELTRVMNGKNAEKLSLENYVLIYYLNHILDSANQQFTKMTNSRYQLVRKKEKSQGLSGLEIEVFDRYSNRTRHITTLSGGETFQASLSLAIGLSNIVQQEAGAIHLESMFIDEGFGTLDSETLETALDTLVNIQMSGRLVGIISHVSELKTRIPTILNVNKNGFLSTSSFITN